jgi:hypothetical protein
MLMTWLGYSLGLEGWCLWRDYDLTLGQLMSPTHPYSGTWPPAPIPAGQIWPGGAPGSGSADSGTAPAQSKPAVAASAASGSSSIITKINEFLPGLGFIK